MEFFRENYAKMGFHRRWVQLTMACVTSVRYSVRFNALETGLFTQSRGIRQGDPLSPYLFLVVAEGLSKKLNGAAAQREIEGIRVCRDAPEVSHLLFADDSSILMHADKKYVENLKRLLDKYCASSGQLVSDAKSSIFFSENTSATDKTEVCTALNIMNKSLNHKYLGLPALVGMDCSDCSNYLIDHV